VTCRSGLLLGVLNLLDDGLEPSPEGSSVCIDSDRHDNCRGGGGALLRAAARYWCYPTEDSNQVVAVS
jgi:hypothetical protein